SPPARSPAAGAAAGCEPDGSPFRFGYSAQGRPPTEPEMTPYGHAMLREFPLDPAITYLNHGTVGVTPRRVLDVQRAIRDEIERQPARFLLRELTAVRVGGEQPEPPRLRRAAAKVAEFV